MHVIRIPLPRQVYPQIEALVDAAVPKENDLWNPYFWDTWVYKVYI